MAKLTKKELKGLLKECLLEILNEENILPALKESYAVDANSQPSVQRASVNDLVAANTNTPAENSEDMRQSQLVRENVGSLAALAGNGKDSALYESILADTALTTYQTQLSDPEFKKGSSGVYIPEHVSREQEAKDKQEIENLVPGQDIGRWAQVAFGKKD